MWFRRPYQFDSPIQDPVQRDVAEQELRTILNALWHLLSDKFWVSHPVAIARAQLKPLQLKIASGAGLRAPETIITNSPAAAREFCAAGLTVFKPVAAYHLEYPDTFRTTVITLLTPEQIKHLELVRAQPVLLQRYIRKTAEVRVTIIGDRSFPVLLSSPDYADIVDWRTPEHNESITYTPHRLPPAVETACVRLTRSLDLAFGAIDLAVDQEGDYHFLEINPIGQWVWIEDETGLPITVALARLLARGGETS